MVQLCFMTGIFSSIFKVIAVSIEVLFKVLIHFRRFKNDYLC